MKVTNVRRLSSSPNQYDISTTSKNFYIGVGDTYVLAHNSPAIFAGIDPSDGKFFVAKKGIFNKNPKVYKTQSDIDADTQGDLNEKMSLALKYLPRLGIKGVVQGDFLFSASDLSTINYDGERHVTFHPNTIVYSVPTNSDLGKKISRAKFGIVWHTRYTGGSFETMSAAFGKSIASELNDVPDIFSVDAVFHDVSGAATMTRDETAVVSAILSKAGKTFSKLDRPTMNAIGEHPDLLMRIMTFYNTKVRAGVGITNTKKFTHELVQWIHAYYEKEAGKRKTDMGKGSVYAKRDDVLKYFQEKDENKIKLIFDLMNMLIEAKLVLIKKLNQAKKMNTLLKTSKGFEITGEEGYVIIDHLGKNAVKLVDRLQFSYANFSNDVVKGWMNDTRS